MEKPEIELAVEVADTVVHALLNETVLKEIPVVGDLVKLIKVGKSIPDRIFAAKVIAFLRHIDQVSDLKKERFLSEMLSDPPKRLKLSEVLVFMLDRMDDRDKAEYMAHVFMAHVEGQIDFDVFRRLMHSIDIGFGKDLKDFVVFMSTEAKYPFYLPMQLRGITAGALAYNSGALKINPPEGPIPYATELGIKFSEIITFYRKRCI
jgi:hypothetical protein